MLVVDACESALDAHGPAIAAASGAPREAEGTEGGAGEGVEAAGREGGGEVKRGAP